MTSTGNKQIITNLFISYTMVARHLQAGKSFPVCDTISDILQTLSGTQWMNIGLTSSSGVFPCERGRCHQLTSCFSIQGKSFFHMETNVQWFQVILQRAQPSASAPTPSSWPALWTCEACIQDSRMVLIVLWLHNMSEELKTFSTDQIGNRLQPGSFPNLPICDMHLPWNLENA